MIDIKGMGFYDVTKIENIFKTYNMIIYTPQGVFDTTKYNLCDALTRVSTGSTALTNNIDILCLGYNPVGDSQGNVQNIDGANLTSKYKWVEIPEHTIEKVIIKSKRNFLPNQNPKTK